MTLRQVAVKPGCDRRPLGSASHAGATVFEHYPLCAHASNIMIGMPVNSTAATLQKRCSSVQAVYTKAPGLTQLLPLLTQAKKNGASKGAAKGLD
jgi:hypothetical protein